MHPPRRIREDGHCQPSPMYLLVKVVEAFADKECRAVGPNPFKTFSLLKVGTSESWTIRSNEFP